MKQITPLPHSEIQKYLKGLIFFWEGTDEENFEEVHLWCTLTWVLTMRFCDNYSHITSKIFTGRHIMQLLLVDAMFERILPTSGSKIYSFLCFFSVYWVILCQYPFIAHSLLCRTRCPVSLHPVSPHPQAGFQLQCFFPCHPSSFPLFFLTLLCSPALSD